MTTTIAYVAPWVTIGGSDKATVDWFRQIDRERFRPILVTTEPSENELLGQLAPYAAETHVQNQQMPGRDLPALIAELVTSRDVGLVHIMNSRLGFDLLPALRDAYPRLATVVQLHAEEPDRSGYVRYVANRYDDVVDAYSVVSHDLRDRLVEHGIAPEKIDVIYLGVDARSEFTPGAPPDPLPYPSRDPAGLEVLFAARLVAQKDPLLMVQVVSALREAGSSARIHVVGDGDLRADIERAVTAAGLEDRVLLHGSATAMCAWYRATDAVLLTSEFEGIPIVAYEAMACARPVVAAAVNAVGELVDATTGFLIDDRSDVASYVDAILRLERDPDRRRELGAAGRERVVSGFTLEQMMRAHERLYDRVLATRASEDPGRFERDLWTGWAPRGTVPLWVDLTAPPGAPRLTAGASAPRGGVWALVARIWTDAFPGTDPLVQRRREGGDPDAPGPAAGGEVLGYTCRQPLPGMVPLGGVLAEAAPGDEALLSMPGWVEPVVPPPGPPSHTWVSLPGP